MRVMQAWTPLVQITLPTVLAILVAAWLHSKRIDDMRDEIRSMREEMRSELREIKAALKDLDHRVTVLEERLGPLIRG